MSTTDISDIIKKVKAESTAGAFQPPDGKSLVYNQDQSGAFFEAESLTQADNDVISLFRKVKQGSVEATPAVEILKTPEETEAAAKQNLATRNEFMRGLYRGIDTTQAAFYGGLGMYSAAMGDTEAADRRFQQYQEQMRQASENPATVDQFFSTDPKKGAFGSVGNFGTWVAGTGGSLIPSVVEAGAAGITGAAIGGALFPAPDPGDVVTVPAGFIGGVFGRAAIKKAMAEAAQKYVEKGVAKEVADRMGRQAVNNVLARRVGGLAAAQRITALQEGGGMYAEGREAGYDNPWSSILLGEASGFLEIGLGNMPFVVKKFIGNSPASEAIKNADPRTAAGYIWDAVKNTGEEGVQEGFQEFLGSVNETINEPEKKLLTKENFMQWAEASAAGALAGAGFGAAGSVSSALQDRAARLKNLKEKGFISEEDAAEAGIEGNSRKERMANVDAEINRIEQEIQVRDTPDPEIASMIDGMISEGESDDEFARQQAGRVQPPIATEIPEQTAGAIPESTDTFMEYVNAWSENLARSRGTEPRPVQARTIQSLRDTIEGRANYAIQMGRSTAFVTDNPTLDALMMKEIQKAVQAKGYQVDDVKRSSEGGTEYIGFNVIGIPQQPQVAPPAATQTPVVDPDEAARLDREYAQKMAAQQPPVIPPQPPQGENTDASAIRSPQEEVRQEQGGADLRGSGQEQVPTQPESQEPPAQAEVQVDDLPEPKSAEEVESLPKFSLYKRTVQGKDYIAIRGDGRRGGGDELYESFEEASQKAESKRSQEQAAIEAAQKKAERESAAAEERSKNLPSYRDWRFNSTARNSGKIVPNKVGVKFLPDQMQSISDWAKSQGFSVSNVTPTGIKVLDPSGKRLDISMYGAAGVKDEKAKAVKAQQEADRRKADEERKKKADSRKSASWITETFGGVINDSNRNALSDFLEGDTDKFKGMVSANWRSGLEKVGALSPEGKIDWGKVKSAYASTEQAAKPESTEKPQPASQATKPPVVKQRLKNAVRFAPDTVIPEGVPFTRGKHPAFGDYIEVFNSHLDRIPGYSKDLPSEGGRTQAKVPSTSSEAESRKSAIRKAIEEQGGFEANSANDVDAIRNKLYDGADTPTGTEIRAVIEEMKIEAGRKAEAEASEPVEQPATEGKTKDFRALPAKSQAKFEELWNAGGTVIAQALGINNKAYRGEFEARTGVKLPKTVKGTNEAVAKWDSEGRKLAGEAKPAAVGPVAEQPKRSEGVEAALKALDAITATEKPKAEPSPKKGRKEPEKTKLGQYVLPIMPGMAAEIDRQDFVRRYRDRALNGLLGWSRDSEDADGIQETIDTLAPMYGDLFNRIYAGEYETVDIALDYEAYQKIEDISDTLPVGQNLILDTLMEQITAAIANFPKKPAKKSPRKSEQTLKEAKSDMQIAHDAAAALMEKIRNKLMSGVDPEISAEVVRVAYLYTKAGVKTFKGYVEAIVENFGDAFAREFSQYMQDGWEALNIRGFVQDPAGNVEDFLKGAVDEKQFYAGADGANQEGVERSDIDGKEPAGAIASEELDGVQPEDGQATEATGDTGGVRDSGVDSIQQGSGRPDGNIQDVDVGGATALPGVAADGTGGGFTKPGDGAGLDLAPESTRPNFHLTNPEIIVGRGLKDKFDRNIKALELSQELEESGRPPTQEDLEVLASYIGWGAFGQELFQGNWNNPRVKKDWESENEWLREHLGEEEWRSAQESIPNAHYTDPEVVSGIWSMIQKMGFKGGRFLEPSFGIGNFAALMPRDMMSKTSFTAIELDKATARIAKILYPQINVQQKGYQDSKTPNDFYDVVATNVPFGNYKISDRMYRMPYSIHNYFFRKAIDQTKPGGLMVFVTSNMTMDGKEEAKLLRKQLSDRGDLVAAFRFPTGAFERYAKTKVVADLIIIRKRKPGEQPSPNNDDWIDVVEVDTPSGVKVSVNAYWTKNPGNILGTLDYGSGTTSGRPGMIVNKPSDLEKLWRKAVESVPSGIINTDRAKNEGKERPNEKKLRQNTVVHQNNELYIAKGEQLMPLKSYVSWYRANSTQATIKKIRDEMVALLNVRDSLEQVLEVQGRGDDASKQREALNKAYDSFRQKYGPISTSKSIGYLKDSGDAIGNAVASLESLTPSGEYEKRPVFTRTTVRQAPRAGEKLDVVDAFALARNDSIDVDFDEVARLARKPKSDVVEELQKADLIYKTGEDTYDAADVFLSGNIARKIRSLEAAKNEGVDGLEKSIDAAKAVLPEPLVYNQIQVGLGAPWVTAEDYSQFFADLLGEDVKNTQVMKAARGWKVNFSTSANRSPGVVTHGHSEVVFSRMVAAAMNNGRVSVFYKDSEGNSHKDETATLEANAKIDELKDKFKDWIWQTPDRIARLSHAFNEDYRSVVTPDWRNIKVPLLFEGLALQRGSDPFSLRKHQEAAVYRAIVSGKGLFAHEVGTGKTLTMASIAIESRRLRLANKPVLFAHNANSQAVYREAQEAYPGAKILYVDNLDSDNKGQAMASIATEDWDLIVIPHSLVKNLKMRPETLEKLLREQMDQLEAAALEAFEEDDSPFKGRMPTNLDDVGKEELAKLKQRTAKELVKERMRLRERIVEAQKDAANESTIFIEDMGIDMLMVDEAHIFKKIPLATRQQVKGLNKQASNIGNSLMLLSDYIRGTQNGRGVYLFTGTPITNTLNEVYNMQRFIMPEEMQAVGVKEWDGWFSTFATSETSDELSAGGTYEEFERLTSFVNLPELRASIGQYMDTVFANEMPEFVPRPTRDGRVEEGDPIIGRPYKQVHNETLDMMPIQKRMSDDLKRRYSQLMAAKGKTKYEMMKTREYNPLTINNEGVKMALDPRLMDGVDPRSVDPRDPRLKINKMIVNAMDYYNQHPKATQMIFMEIGHSDWSERVVGRDNDGKPIKERVRVYNLAKEIKRRLIEEGVAEKEIAIFSAMSKEQRSEAAKAMNRGEIRFAIGGTETLGTGVNAQENLVAMHHLDAPWMPGSLEQRNGRGHRQGNRWNTVHEHRYLTEGPQDGRRWQVLLTKDRFIYRFMHDVGDERIIDMSDVDMDEEGEGGFESTFAAAVGDPRIQQRFKLEREIQKLEQARDRHYRTIQDTLWEARNQSTQDIPRLQKDIDELSKMQKTYRDSKPQADKDGKVPEPVMTLGDVAGFPNKEIRGAESIGEALQDLFERYSVSSLATGDAKKKKVAEYRGIGIFILGKQMFAEKQYYEIKPSFSSMDGLLRNLGKRIENKNAEIEKKQAFVKSANESAKLPFVRQEQLDIKQKKLKSLVAEIEANPEGSPSWFRNIAPVGTSIYIRKRKRASGRQAVDDMQAEMFKEQMTGEPAQENVSYDIEEHAVTGYRSDTHVLYEENGESVAIEASKVLNEEGEPIYVEAKAANDEKNQAELSDNLRNLPPPLYQTAPDVNENMWSEALNLSTAAQDAGIKSLRDFVAYSVKTIGRDRTLQISRFLRLAAEVAGMDGVQQSAAVSGITRDQVVTMAKRAFGKVLSEDQIETGITLEDITAFGRNEIGFAPYGTPVPGQAMAQEDFDQPSGYKFNESDYRHAVVSYARDKWGEKIAPNGKPIWQNFVRWFGDSVVVDKDGKPLVVYHGGAATIDDNTVRTPFFYMTANRSEAEYWAGENSRVHEFYLKFTKPYRDSQHDDRFMDMEERAQDYDWDDPEFAEELRETTREAVSRMNELKSQGYNSIVMQGELDETYDNYIAFDPTQIKSATGNVGTFDPNNPSILMQEVANPQRRSTQISAELEKELDAGEKVSLYRAMMLIDGKLYPPMSGKVADESGKARMREPEPIGKWMRSQERPDLIAKSGRNAGKFKLEKAAEGTDVWVTYAPYFHSSPIPLNDQFSAAWLNDGVNRPQIVTVEIEVPRSELTSGYQAEKSPKKVGANKWNAGVVASKIPGGREVVLSRYARIKRIVPDAEVAKRIAEIVNPARLSIPENVVTPQLLAELKKNDVRIAPAGTSGDDIFYQNQQQGGSVKGWTKFISAHRALIGATSEADFSTFIHEFFHPMRLFLLNKSVPAEKRAGITDEEIEMLEKYSGVKNGVWTVEAEEKAAKMWEQYWYEGISPNSVLDSLFQKISRWMREIYSGVQEITGTSLRKEIRDLFDKLVQRGLPADQRGGKGGEPVSRGEPVLRPVDPVTSIQNEVANQIALLRGSQGLVEPEAQTMDEWLEEASNRLRQDPTLGDRLVKELDADPTGPDQIDTAVLQMHYRGLNNALYAAQDRLFAAKDRKDSVAAAKALKEVDAITNSLEEMERVDKKIGTLQARAFGARKITLYADFSPAALLRRGRAANGGERLNEEQKRQIAELAAELAKVQGDLAKAEQVIADLQRQDGVRQVVDDDIKKTPKPKTKSEPREKAATAVQSFVKKFASIFKPKGDSGTLMQTEDERMAEEAESVVMAYVEAGVFSYGELLANLRKEIGGELPVQAQAAFATAWEKIKAQGEIPIPMVSPGDVEGLTRIAREIQMAIIESGIVTADQEDRAEVVLDAVWRSLQEIDPEITERQTMDALSGYGQFTPLSKDEMKRLQRDINGQLLQMAKIKDLEADIRPKATGAQRREMSDEERALVRQVNELKRNSKLYTEDRDGLLKTAIGAALRATANRIRDLRKAMDEGKPITKTQVDLASKDKDLAEQKRILAEVTKDYREMFPRQGATPEQRLAAALRAIDREIARVEEQLRTGDFSPRGRAEPVTSAELRAKQAELESLRAQRDAIKAQQNPKMSPKERAEVAYIANLKNRIADYEDRMAHGYFGAKPKKAPLESDEITKHKRRLEEIKEEFFRLAAEWRLSQMSPKERFFDWARETSFLARAIMTSMDLSAVFRQGGPGTFAHPMLAKEAAKEMRRAIFSQEEEFNIAEQMSKHRLYSFAVQAKLEVTASAGRIQNQEEAYMGRWARDGIGKKGTKINKFSKAVLIPVAASARAYTTYLNGLRFRLFVYFVDTLGANGQVTLDEAKAIANFINVSTGRGDFGSYNKVAANLSTVLFAPRYLVSRFLYLGLPFYMLQDAKVSGRVKRLIAMEYARHALGVAGFLATAVALGGLLYDDDDEDYPTVELDPRSTDFMKLKIGETRIDPLSGFGQIATFISQVGIGQKKTMEGEIIDIRGEKKKYGQDGTFEVAANFVRKKLAPIPAAGMNIIAGEDVVGNKATVATATTGLFIPLAGREVVETLMARGVPEGPAIAMLNILGMSGGTYGPKTKYKNANAEERKKLIEKDLEAMEWDSKDPGYKDFLTRDELERFKQRREQRKQSLVYAASANPKRKDFQDDTTYAKAVAERDKALKTMIDGKIGPEEARLLLLAYWRRNSKNLYERKGQALVLKDALVERLRQITQKLNQK